MKPVFAALLAILLITASGCGNEPAPGEGGVTFVKPSSPPPPGEVPEGSILDFSAPRMGGGEVVGSEFVNRDVAIWFWAPW